MEIVICEDDRIELDMVYEKLRAVLGRAAIGTGIVRFSSGRELLTHVRNGRRFGLYILDILLGETESGIEVARQIRTLDTDAQIAFLTNSREYAVDAFAVRAIHYLVKPVTEEGLMSVVERWHRETNKQEEYLEIQDGKERSGAERGKDQGMKGSRMDGSQADAQADEGNPEEKGGVSHAEK